MAELILPLLSVFAHSLCHMGNHKSLSSLAAVVCTWKSFWLSWCSYAFQLRRLVYKIFLNLWIQKKLPINTHPQSSQKYVLQLVLQCSISGAKAEDKNTHKHMMKFRYHNFLFNYVSIQPSPLGKESFDDTSTWVTLKAVPLHSGFPNFVTSKVRQR